MLEKTNLKISGLHCRSCKTLIEAEVKAMPGVKTIDVDYLKGEVVVEFENGQTSLGQIAKEIEGLNYAVEVCSRRFPASEDSVGREHKDRGEKTGNRSFWSGLFIPVFIAALFGGLFLANRLGGFELLAQLNEGRVSYGLIFVIGLLAGFHCVGMCGGLVVAYSAGQSREGGVKNLTPHFQYNFGRLIAYTLIGGVLGAVGSFFGINPAFTGFVMFVAAVFMILMGLSFIKNWAILEKIKLRTPEFIARFIYKQKHASRPKEPFVIGLLNGFMPCGPLQAMQLYALTSGSFLSGALSMAVYASGTIPMMLGLGAFLSRLGQAETKKMMKASGLLIIALGLIMLNRSLINFGYGVGMETGSKASLVEDGKKDKNGSGQEEQIVNMEFTYYGYKPNVLYIKRGLPVRWVINVKEMSGCTNAIEIASLGIKKDLEYGENIIEFTPPADVKEIKFSCWMRMVWGKFIITDGDTSALDVKPAQAAEEKKDDGLCNIKERACK